MGLAVSRSEDEFLAMEDTYRCLECEILLLVGSDLRCHDHA